MWDNRSTSSDFWTIRMKSLIRFLEAVFEWFKLLLTFWQDRDYRLFGVFLGSSAGKGLVAGCTQKI